MKKKCKMLSFILIAALLALALTGCTGSGDPGGGEKPIVVSSKTFVEAIIMGNLTVELLRDRGYEVVDEVGLGEVAVMRPAITSGQVDVYWEYTGTALVVVMGAEALADGEEAFQKVKKWDLEENDLVWLDYAPANNTHVIFISSDLYDQYQWTKISELAEHIGQGEKPLKMSLPSEWFERQDGLEPFENHYGFQFDRSQLQFVELGLTYESVGRELADVGIGDATEGRIAQFGLHVLEDDQQFFPAYNPAPVIRGEVLDTYPELEEVFKELSSLLDADTLVELNKKVAVEGMQPEAVAKDFLLEKGLVKQ